MCRAGLGGAAVLILVGLLVGCGTSAVPTPLPTVPSTASPLPATLAPTDTPIQPVPMGPTPIPPCRQANRAPGLSRLVVEEHLFKARGFSPTEGSYFETVDGTSGEKNRAYRDPSSGRLLERNNDLLRPFGYRIERECAGPTSTPVYNLYQEDRFYLGPIGLSPVSVNASGTDFTMALDRYLLTRDGLRERDPSRSYPLYVGDELLTVTTADRIQVFLGDRLIYAVPTEPNAFLMGIDHPGSFDGVWAYDGHWVIEWGEAPGAETLPVYGHVVQDGQDLNVACGYDESFGFALLDGRPFYFFRRGAQTGIFYDGQELPVTWEVVYHYGCGTLGYSQNMVWFFSNRNAPDYYVEAYVPLAETPELSLCPAPTPGSAVTPLPSTAGLPGTPAAGAAQARDVDGMVMLYVPAGAFPMGSLDGVGQEDEHPQHAVTLDAFWIDRTEITNALYQTCAEAGACRVQGMPWYDPQGRPDHPVEVTWDNAEAYCRWVGARLPTEAEWEKAARGTDGRTYPWGSREPDCETANYLTEDHFCVWEGASPVASYPSGASPYGVLDMAGNVAEWVNDWYDPDYYARSPAQNPPGPGTGVSRVIQGCSQLEPSYHPGEALIEGGAAFYYSRSGHSRVVRGGAGDSYPYGIRSADRDGWAPEFREGLFGFRCVLPAAPASTVERQSGPE